jgi:subtilisin-like proprotein convertase family protein
VTEVTITGIQVHNYPTNIVQGTTERRLVKIYVDCTSAATDDTLDLSTYVPGFSAITNINEALDGAQNAGSVNTWSTTTITFAGHAGSGVWKLEVLGYF